MGLETKYERFGAVEDFPSVLRVNESFRLVLEGQADFEADRTHSAGLHLYTEDGQTQIRHDSPLAGDTSATGQEPSDNPKIKEFTFNVSFTRPGKFVLRATTYNMPANMGMGPIQDNAGIAWDIEVVE